MGTINTFGELYKQYCNAMGKKSVYTRVVGIEELEKEMYDFETWLYEHAIDTENYGLYLRSVIDGFETIPALEINKGFYDTLYPKNYNVEKASTISYMGLEDKTLMFCEERKMLVPCIYSHGKIRNLNFLDFDLLISHNPYSYEIDDVHKSLSLIHKQGTFNVSFGVFGRESDVDKAEKMKLLKKFADSLGDDYRTSYESDKSLYFASVNSKRKTKVLIK